MAVLPYNVSYQPTGWFPQYGSATPVVQYASFATATSASAISSIVGSSTGYRVLVLAAAIGVNDTASSTSFRLVSSASSATQATNSFGFASNTGETLVLPYNPVGWFSTALNDSLAVHYVGNAVTGMVTFIYI